MPNLRAAASSTRRPSGMTSLPIPSPGMTAIPCLPTSCRPRVRRAPLAHAAEFYATAIRRRALDPAPRLAQELFQQRRAVEHAVVIGPVELWMPLHADDVAVALQAHR